ncbi:MAG: hypothetical protein AB7T49_08870 [Oligoflexales bacterium]
MSFVPPLNIGPLADRELHDLKRRYAAKTEHEVSHDFIRPSDSYIAAAKAFFKLAIYSLNSVSFPQSQGLSGIKWIRLWNSFLWVDDGNLAFLGNECAYFFRVTAIFSFLL